LFFPFLFAVEELYGTLYQSGSFSLIIVGSGFNCLRSFLFFFLFSGAKSLASKSVEEKCKITQIV